MRFRRRLNRAVVIIVSGYVINFPFGVFLSDPEKVRTSWEYFQTVGVLQCIGATLLILELVTIVARSARQVILASSVLALAVMFLAPFADAMVSSPEETNFFLNWVSHNGRSQFPLFPWAGFVLSGVGIGAFVLPQSGRTSFKKILVRLAISFAVCTALYLGVEELVKDPAISGSWVNRSNPVSCFERLRKVLGLVLFLAIVCKPIKELPSILRMFAKQTLNIYMVHLIILYWPLLAINYHFKRSLPLHWSLAMSAGVMALTFTIVWWWHGFKNRGYKFGDPAKHER